jgi:hypothetical protein
VGLSSHNAAATLKRVGLWCVDEIQKNNGKALFSLICPISRHMDFILA